MLRHVHTVIDVAETRAGVVNGASMIDSGVARTRITKTRNVMKKNKNKDKDKDKRERERVREEEDDQEKIKRREKRVRCCRHLNSI
jgi:membrane protein involved in colicin uptake